MAKLGQYGHQLHTMTAQEVLDVGVEHLLTQMEKSEEDRQCHCVCLYDGGDVCCGAAPFIKDEQGFGYMGEWGDLVTEGYASETHELLITQLQSIHDLYSIDEWATELRRLATIEKLVYNGEQYE